MERPAKKIETMREMAFQSTDLGADSILSELYEFIEENEETIKECYNVDSEIYQNRSSLAIKRMLDTIDSIRQYEFSDTKIYTLLNERKFIIYKQNKGVLGVIYDGDVYITIELIAKAIKTGNALYLNIGLKNNIGTNNLIVQAVKKILEKNEKLGGLIEINFSENNDLVNEDLDSLIIIGNRETQDKYSSFNYDVIKSGYGYCEIYIDDLNNEEFIKEVIKSSDFKLQIFINSQIQTDIKGHRVKNCEDAINHINKQGANFASVIFSDNTFSQKIFLKRCKAKHVFVNSDPNIAEDSNIQIEDFYYNKIGMV